MKLLFLLIPLFFLIISAIAMLMLKIVIDEEKLQRRISRAGGSLVSTEAGEPEQGLHIRIIVGLGFAVARSGMLSVKTVADLRHTLRMAGIRDQGALGMFVGAKLLTMLGLPLLIFMLSRLLGLSSLHTGLFAFAGMVGGVLAPDMIIQQRRKRFVKRVEAGLADALDLMVICADAGLSLEAGIARVAGEVKETHAAVAQELTITSNEMRIGGHPRDALSALGVRTGLDSLKRLGSTLIQTIQYGTPLTQALRTLSAELRLEELTRFEERAARLPVLLTMPMIIFILPCVFLIVGGPAMLKVLAVI